MCIASCVCVHQLVSLPGMGKRKFRTLKDLYHTTQQVSLSTQPFKFEMEEKSRTCNLCASRCSACTHFDQVAALVRVETGEFTNKTSKEKRDSRCSSIDGVLFPPLLSSACDSRQHTSSEASNIFNLSSSHHSFSENAEIQATFRDSGPCKGIELIFNIRKAQPARESGDAHKGLTNFDSRRFSNHLEKHKESEILGDNHSCIRISNSANLAIDNHNGDPDRKNASYGLTSDDSIPVDEKDMKERLGYHFIAGTHFDKANGNHTVVQNFTEDPPLAEGETLECSSERLESSIERAAISGLGGSIDGIYSYASFGGTGPHMNCFETESNSYCKNYLQKSVAVIKNTSTQESRQSQPGNPRGVPDLMDDEVGVCDTCGDRGREDLLALCNKCPDGAEHIYCMRVKLNKVPDGDWTCAECMLMPDNEQFVQDKVEDAARISKGVIECQKSENSVKLESRSSSKLKFRPSYAGKNGLSAKRYRVPLEAQSVKKARVIGTSALSSKSSKPCNNSLLRRDFSCRNIKKAKMKSIKDITSARQISCNSQEKSKVPPACGDKKHAATSEAELDKKGRALKTRVISPKDSTPSNQSLLIGEPPFKNLGKAKLEVPFSVTSVTKSSYGTQQKAMLPYRLSDESPKLGSHIEIARDKRSLLKSKSSKATDLKSKGQLTKGGCLQKQKVERNPAFHVDRKGKGPRNVTKTVSFNIVGSEKSNATCSEVLLANAYCPKLLKNSTCIGETKAAKGKDDYELHNRAMCLLASYSGATAVKESKKETISCDETLFSGSDYCKVDAVQSSGQLDYILQPSNPNNRNDLNCPNEEKKNESWQAECPTKTATAMKIHELCTSLASDVKFHPRDLAQFKEAILSQDFVIPKPDYIWLGKFHIHTNEGITSTCDGIQAHLSTCASHKVLEMVDKLPEIIILEELPRLRMWPAQFMGSQATEENIALYFFAKDLDSYRTYYRRLMEYMTKNDLALKGILDGVELLIFPSNVLPEKSQCWNKMLFFWGVFKGRKVNNSANTPLTNSQKLENREIVKNWTLDLNAYPEDEDKMARVDEIPKSDSTVTRPSGGDSILVGGDSYSRQALDKGGEENPRSLVIDLNISLWPESATQNDDGIQLSVGIEDNETKEEVHGKLLMSEKNNVDNRETSRSLPPARASLAICEENLDPLDSEAADTLIFLSQGLRKI